MSRPANTSISFQLTDIAVKDKSKQISLQWKKLFSFVNMSIKIKTTEDNVADVMLQPNYSMLIVPEMDFYREESNDAPFRVEGSFVCKA